MSEYASARAVQDRLYREMDAASDKLNTYPKGAMGLTPDSVKASPEWQSDSRRYALAFATVRAFNSKFTKHFKREIQAERAARVAA